MNKFKLLTKNKPVKVKNKQEIIITVSGSCGSGKSRITYLMKKFFREIGIEVQHTDVMDHRSELEFDIDMENNLNEVISNFVESRKITFSERQLPRRYNDRV